MLVNRAIERARELRLKSWLLRWKSEPAGERAPVVLVPPFLGTKLVDPQGRVVWGQTRRLFFGPKIAGAADLRPSGILEELPIVPGLLARDILGGLLRFLIRAGGYRRDEDLFVLEYDFRAGVAHGAARLAELVDQIRGSGAPRVDLLCVSSGGAIGRYFMAYRGVDVVRSRGANGEAGPSPSPEPAALVRRVIYVGAPHRGSFGVLAQIHEGVVMVPGGRRFPPQELADVQTVFDFLPRPGDPLFLDLRGQTLPIDLYKAETWAELGLAGGLAGIEPKEFQVKLTLGESLHRVLDRASIAHPDTIVIGARHQPTRARLLVDRGRALMPPCCPEAADPYAGYVYEPGDGSLPETSLRGAPGLAENGDQPWLVSSPEHHLMPSDPEVHRLVLEALRPGKRLRQGDDNGAA